MRLRAVEVMVAAALLVLPGCTKHVYFAVLAPNEAMEDRGGCFRQCQLVHAGQTKHFLSCVETCPGTRIVKAKRCNDLSYDDEEYGCVTAHAQAFDGVAFGLGIGVLVLLNVLAVLVLAASNNRSGVQ